MVPQKRHAYNNLSSKILHKIFDHLDTNQKNNSSNILDLNNDILEYTNADGTYIINKQTPKEQIWLSSPLSGPSKFSFDFEKGIFKDERTNEELFKFVKNELNKNDK